MKVNDFLQIQQMCFILGVLIYVVVRIEGMQFSFFKIIWNIFLYFIKGTFGKPNDQHREPADWLISNRATLFNIPLLLLGWGELMLLAGLAQQFRLNAVSEKSWYFYFGSPLVQIGIFGLLILNDEKAASWFVAKLTREKAKTTEKVNSSK